MTSNVGAGQLTPYDGQHEINVISFLVQRLLAQVSTVKVVQVKAVHGGGVNAAPPTVDVLPLVNQLDGSGNSTPHGTVSGLPVLRIGAGTGSLIFDPQVGDIGVALVSDRDISSIKANNGAQSNPGSRRRHHISDGIYLGCLFGKAPTNYIAFNANGGFTITDQFGNRIQTGQNGITVTGNLIVTGNIQLGGSIEAQNGGTYAGNISTTGDVVAKAGASSVTLSTHKHTQGVDSHGDTEQPTNSPTGGT